MTLSRSVSSLLLAFLLHHTAAGLPLRDQLAFAERDDDAHAQIELIRRILDVQPDDAELRERLAFLWLSVEDYDMAERVVHEWADAPEPLRVQVLATVLFLRDQRKAEAAALLEGYLSGHRDDLEMTRQLASYLVGMGEEQKAVDLLSAAPGVENDAGLLLSRALARRKLRDFANALKDFAAADRLDSEDQSVVSNRPSFERLRAALAGIDAAGAILAGKPDDFSARMARAYWYLFTGVASGLALEEAEAAQRIDANSVAARILFAAASNQAERLSARDALETYEVDVSKPVPALAVLERLQRYDLQLAKDARNASGLLARCQELSAGAQQYRLAVRDADAVLGIDPGAVKARAAKISALAKLGRFDYAADEFRVLEAAKPPRDLLAGSLNELSEAATGASQLDSALEYANRAIKTMPLTQYYKQRAALLQRLERFADAEADLSRAEQLEKGNAR